MGRDELSEHQRAGNPDSKPGGNEAEGAVPDQPPQIRRPRPEGRPDGDLANAGGRVLRDQCGKARGRDDEHEEAEAGQEQSEETCLRELAGQNLT